MAVNDITINIVNEGKDDPLEEFMRMIAWMDICTSVGHNVKFNVCYLGDFSADLRFTFLEKNDRYKEIKKQLFNDFNTNRKEPQQFII